MFGAICKQEYGRYTVRTPFGLVVAMVLISMLSSSALACRVTGVEIYAGRSFTEAHDQIHDGKTLYIAAGETVYFCGVVGNNRTENDLIYRWDFQDGTVQYDRDHDDYHEHIAHTYSTPIVYEPSLKVWPEGTSGTGSEVDDDECTIEVVEVKLYRDSAYTKVLDDWPASGGIHSPKYIFGKDDAIYVQVKGLGEDPHVQEFATCVKVLSETSAAWPVPQCVFITMKETGVNTQIFRNSLASDELLYLGDFTSDNPVDDDHIEVIDEEKLTFKLKIGSTLSWTDSKEVMVDRGEYSWTAIDQYKIHGPEFKGEMEASRVDWWQAGYAIYPDDVGADPLEPMKHFIKDAGMDSVGHREGDFMLLHCHSNCTGRFADNDLPTKNTIMYPSDINPNSDWNNDVEFVWFHTCKSLPSDPDDPNCPGRDEWDDALFGSGAGGRPAHMILGYHDEPTGDLKYEIDDFFDHACASPPETIVNAFYHANTDGWWDEPAAIVEHKDNDLDQLKCVTRDTTSTSMRYYWFEDRNPLPDIWHDDDYSASPSSGEFSRAKGDVKNYQYHGGIQIEIACELPKGPRVKVSPLEVEILPLKSRPDGFKHFKRTYGLEVFSKEIPHRDPRPQNREKAQEAAQRTLASIFEEMPEANSLIASESTFYALDFERGKKPNLSAGIPVVRGIKYLHIHKGIPILGDILSAAVAGDEVVKIRTCWHKLEREKTEQSARVVAVEDSLPEAADNLVEDFQDKKALRFKLRKAGLCYYGFHETGKDRKIFVPTWRFLFEQDDGKLYVRMVNAHSNKAIKFKVDKANAMQKHRELLRGR